MKDTKHNSSEKARDGYFRDLPENLQHELLKAHNMINDKVNSLLEDPKYKMIKDSGQAMSSIDSFLMGPGSKSDIGAARAYCKGKDKYSCMIQLTGHFRNYQNDPIEELLHDFIHDVYTGLKSTFKKEFKFDLDSEGADGNSFEGFDVYPDKEVAKEIWELFEDHKTKTVVECTQDLLDYYEFYNNISYDQFFLERSHGLLNFSFRIGFNVENGHKVKIVFDLKPENVEIFGNNTKDSVASRLSQSDQLVNPRTGRLGPNMGKLIAKMDDDNRRNIKKLGDVDFASQAMVKAIVDLDTKKKLSSVNATGVYMGIAGQSNALNKLDKLGSDRKFFPNNFASLDIAEREKIAASIGSSVSFSKYTVGEREPDTTFKTTSGRTDNAYKLLNDSIIQGNIRNRAMEIDSRSKGFNKPRQIDHHLYASKKRMTESADSPEYNVEMSEANAKKAIRVVSKEIMDKMANQSRGKSITQYTLNIYANVITKNLLPKWTTGYRSIKITLDASSAGNSFEFIPPTMTQDFVSRFVAGRESLNGFLHKTPEIRIRISPSTFQTMKDPDDAFNFFKFAIQYYDSKIEKYGNKLMSEVMKLGHNMKHLIGNSKLSGLVTYPLSLLFTFDDVDMSSKNTFAIKDEDIQTINKFVRNIASRYAAPEKEKRQIVDDVKKMVTALKESCEYSQTISDIIKFPESLEKLYFGGFEDVIMESSRVFIESNLDHEWTRKCSDPKLKLLQEQFGVKKLKKIPTDLVAYISIETEAIKDANDKMMIASYCLGKLEIVEWYIELLEVGSKRYVVPHTKAYLQGVRTQLLACFKKIMDTPLPKADRPLIDIQYPKGYEG